MPSSIRLKVVRYICVVALKMTVVHVFVQDNGVGIAAYALDKVFEMHAWSYESNSPRYIKGTGLGLPIARQIVQMHHGKIWAESVAGSRFSFPLYFPDF